MTEILRRFLARRCASRLTQTEWFELARARIAHHALDHSVVGRISEEVIDILEHARRAGWGPVESVDMLRVLWLLGSAAALEAQCRRWGMKSEHEHVTLH
jgi:hypothetical protein